MRATIVAAVLSAMTIQSATTQEPLALVRTIDLPGVEGRIDHLAFDPGANRLYVAALGNNSVEVLDVEAGRHVRSVPGFREPQGLAAVPEMKTVAVANGEGEGVQLISTDDYHSKAMVRLGDDADNVRYD